MPAGVVPASSQQIDVDGDGKPDTVSSYATSAAPRGGDWHLRVDLSAGGGADLTLADDPTPGPVQVLGAAYLGPIGPAGDSRPAIFVWVRSGASARIVNFFRLDRCQLVAMHPMGLPIGAGVLHQEGLRCETVDGMSLLWAVASQMNPSGSGFSVTRVGYTRDGNSLVENRRTGPLSALGPPPEAGGLDCPGVGAI